MEEATSTAVGVARPRAQGHATTITSTASFKPKSAAELDAPLMEAASNTPGNKFGPAAVQKESAC